MPLLKASLGLRLGGCPGPALGCVVGLGLGLSLGLSHGLSHGLGLGFGLGLDLGLQRLQRFLVQLSLLFFSFHFIHISLYIIYIFP